MLLIELFMLFLEFGELSNLTNVTTDQDPTFIFVEIKT
jgi:hypothetical protein